ncbi:uncharacterized protein LOC134249375 [Saccostrea cucullata]|uniref:uncharacterized protein LOC134249375 n=1 Tax=Saccostrea cuccullata TaxID=36930 RepID=UPI002ED0283E
MDWVLKLASAILLFELVEAFPRNEKEANKYESDSSHRNLRLELHHEKNDPQHQKNILVPYENSLKQIAKNPASDRSGKVFQKLFSGRTMNTPQNREPSSQNRKDSVEKYALLALIPMRGRRTWRRRGFKIYNAVPDARYHFDSMAIDPMFNFLGIGK